MIVCLFFFPEITCSLPAYVPDGRVNFTSLSEGSVYTVTCNQNYRLPRGVPANPQARCRSDGTWEPLPVVCERTFFYKDNGHRLAAQALVSVHRHSAAHVIHSVFHTAAQQSLRVAVSCSSALLIVRILFCIQAWFS